MDNGTISFENDSKFVGVVNRLDKSILEPGFVSRAVNRVFDSGVIKNRWGVVRPPWGGIWSTSARTVTLSSSAVTSAVVSGTAVPANVQVYSDPLINVVSKVTITNGGSGYTNGSGYALIFSGGGGSGAAGTFTVSGGAITSISLTSGGNGYSSAPSVSFSNAGAGTGSAYVVTMAGQKMLANGTRSVSDNGTTLTLTQRSLGYDGNAQVSFFNGLTAFQNIVGVLTYREPVSGLDVLLIATNEPRSDGGQGYVYAVRPGQSNRSILVGTNPYVPMNGHDFYGNVNFVQCGDGVLMFRSGLPRYYFTGSSSVVDAANKRITLSVTPDSISTGDRVVMNNVSSAPDLGSAANRVSYYARRIASTNKIELYDSKANAINTASTTGIVSLTASSSAYRYYVEAADPQAWWSHQQLTNVVSSTPNIDSIPLIMQSTSAVGSPLSVGFTTTPTVAVSSVDTATSLCSAQNHRLVPGDSVNLTNQSGMAGAPATSIASDGTVSPVTYYVYPADPNSFYLYSTQIDAMGNTGTNKMTITSTGTATVVKTGVSGGPIPNCRDGIYFANRVYGIYGPDLMAVSDVLNPTVYLPLQSDFRLNSGTNDRLVAIYPFNESTIVVFKQRSILAISHTTNDLSSVRLIEITRDYGCVSAKSIASNGSQLLWLSQRGVVTLNQTDYGLAQTVPVPLSDPIAKSIARIDWSLAKNACAAYFDNKYILSVPTVDGDGTNDLTLVFNFLNNAWDGEWSGSYLKPRFFERVFSGQFNRLVFADNSGFIHYFDPDGKVDRLYSGTESQIQTLLELRGYDCDTKEHKQWRDLHISCASWNPLYSVTARHDDYNSDSILASNVTKSRTTYSTYGSAAYDVTNVNNDFNNQNREDYSFTPGLRLGASGVRSGIVKSFVTKLKLRRHSIALQPIITTTQGELQVEAVTAYAIPHRIFAGATEE